MSIALDHVSVQQLRDELALAEQEAERLTGLVQAMIPFVAVWAAQYAVDYGMDGLHPKHYDILQRAGARMDGFKRAQIASADKGGAG